MSRLIAAAAAALLLAVAADDGRTPTALPTAALTSQIGGQDCYKQPSYTACDPVQTARCATNNCVRTGGSGSMTTWECPLTSRSGTYQDDPRDYAETGCLTQSPPGGRQYEESGRSPCYYADSCDADCVPSGSYTHTCQFIDSVGVEGGMWCQLSGATCIAGGSSPY